MQIVQKPESYLEGKSVFLGDDKQLTVLTKELAEKLNEDEIAEFSKKCDVNPFEDEVTAKWLGRNLLVSSQSTVSEYLNDISLFLETLRKELNEEYLMILGGFNVPWLCQDNDYLPVKQALKYLANQIDDTFSGGFLLNKNELFEFIPHLFWFIRCNASLPEFYLSYPNSRVIISICKYGVLHVDFFGHEEKDKVLKLSSYLNFREVKTCQDPIKFDDFNGRELHFKNDKT